MSTVYDEIINSSNIQTILEYYGLNISKKKCNCPFHKDTHPSMSININKGIAKCFACGTGGNAITFIEKYENEVNHNPITFKEAMQKAIDIQHLNITIPNGNSNIQLTEEQLKKQRRHNILKDAISISESNLKSNNVDCKNVFSYLEGRKLSKETINHFHIGYDPDFNTITDELLKKYKLEELISIGLLKEYNNNYIDVFNNRITIPIFDENGNPVGFGARTMQTNNKAKYLNTKETELFNKSKLLFNFHKAKYYAKNDEIIIVEGYMDVISSKEMKIDNTVGIMGTALTKEHIKTIKQLNCDITLCLDNDKPGKDAMIRAIPELLKNKIKVNVLDISKLGNYKDFGDLQVAGITKEQVYSTKISAFTFLMQYKYAKNIDLTVENIHSIHKKLWKDKIVKDSKDYMNFKEYIINHSNFNSEEIDNIINPKEIKSNTRVDRYKDIYFYYYIIGLIKNYANKNQDNILLKYIELGKLDANKITETLDNEKYLEDDSLGIKIGKYIQDNIYNSEDYIQFKNDKVFIFDKMLKNAQAFDSKGNVVKLSLTIKQKEMIIKQYSESFDDSIKNYIEQNPDEFEEIFIANNEMQFKKLFPKTYKEAFKDEALSRFKNDGVMEAIRYGLAYNEEMKAVMTRQFVNNGKYKTLLVFNNNNNILGLTSESVKKEIEQEPIIEEKQQNIVKEKVEPSKPVSILIKLPGNQTETSRGMYLPINEEKQIYIPKQLYNKKENSQLELLHSKSNQLIMSEYDVDLKEHTKKWISRLSLEEFYKKYFNLYEIKMEKEVMA